MWQIPFKIHSPLSTHARIRILIFDSVNIAANKSLCGISFWILGFQLPCHNHRALTSIDRESVDDYYYVFTFQLSTLFGIYDPSISSRRLASFVVCAITYISHVKWITSFRYNIYGERFLFSFSSSSTQHTFVAESSIFCCLHISSYGRNWSVC